MRLLQLKDHSGRFAAARDDDGALRRLRGYDSVYALALHAADSGAALSDLIRGALGEAVDEDAFFGGGAGCALPPVDHPDPARLTVSGTGLTHFGSAQTRDSMHVKAEEEETPQTDSMRMFRLGAEGGKPPAETFWGAQPEWFYKGDGRCIAPPGGELLRPAYAMDGGEEAELAGIYIISGSGQPYRIGFALGNEYSDHVMEKQNYLWLAHSKLRQCSLGPELLPGALPPAVAGAVAARRGGEIIWRKEFFSGEEHMCHSIANLERHHFKYDVFCAPGSLHVHFFGAAELSFADGFAPADGDEFIIESPLFGRPLINRLRVQAAPVHRGVKIL